MMLEAIYYNLICLHKNSSKSRVEYADLMQQGRQINKEALWLELATLLRAGHQVVRTVVMSTDLRAQRVCMLFNNEASYTYSSNN